MGVRGGWFPLLLSVLAAPASGQSYSVEVGSSTRCAGLIDIRSSGTQVNTMGNVWGSTSITPGMRFPFFGSTISAEASFIPKAYFTLDLVWPMAAAPGTQPQPTDAYAAKSGFIGAARTVNYSGLGLWETTRGYWEVRGTAPDRTLVFLWQLFTTPDTFVEAQIREDGIIEFDYAGPAIGWRSWPTWIGLNSTFTGEVRGFESQTDALAGLGCVRFIPTATAAPADPYAVEARTTRLQSIATTGAPVALVADVGAPGTPDFVGHAVLNAPFGFGVLGTSVTSSATLRVESNGSLWVGNAQIAALSGPELVGSRIYSEVSGPLGDRVWTLEWSGVEHGRGAMFVRGHHVDLQIQVHETSSQVTLLADNIAGGEQLQDWNADVSFGPFSLCPQYYLGESTCSISSWPDSIAYYRTLVFTPNVPAVSDLRLVRTSTLPPTVLTGAALPIEVELINGGGSVLGAEVAVFLDGSRLAARVTDIEALGRIRLTLTATLPAARMGDAELSVVVDPAHALPERDRSDDVVQLGHTYVGVPPALELVTTSLPTATVAVAYQTTVSARGGVGALSWAVLGVPAGLVFDAATETLSGTPTAAGSFSLSFTVRDALGQSIRQDLLLLVRESVSPPPTLVLNTTVLPLGKVGVAYSLALRAEGGSPPLSFSAAPLPAGLELSGATISGTPSASGTTMVVLTVHDAATQIVARTLSLTVDPAITTNPIVFDTTSLPQAMMGAAYDVAIVVHGGVGPLTLSATGVPPGLGLDAAGHLRGTPSAVGTSMIQLRAMDAAGTQAEMTMALTVVPQDVAMTTSSSCGCSTAQRTPDVSLLGALALMLWRRKRGRRSATGEGAR